MATHYAQTPSLSLPIRPTVYFYDHVLIQVKHWSQEQ